MRALVPPAQRARVGRSRSFGVPSSHGSVPAWPTADGARHIGTWLTPQTGAISPDLNELLTLRHIERDQIGFHRPNDEGELNTQFAIGLDQR
jgi:hypothetical protein